MEDHGSPALRRLLDGDAVEETHARHGDATARVARQRVVPVMRFLREDPETRFEMLADLTAVDYLGETPRFEVVYHLYSLEKNQRLRIKARVPEDDCAIDSIVAVWPAANWLEREVWDMYGIRFRGHPDLRRLLLYEEFQGHPLRKDYAKEKRQPLIGPEN
jgi:NADH-quinone oxidoreductase subunit C